MTIKKKILLLLLVVALIPLLFSSIFSYISMHNALKKQVLTDLDAIAEIEKERVDSILQQKEERLRLVINRSTLKQTVDAYNKDKKKEDQQKIIALLFDSKNSIESFRELTVLNNNGNVIASTNSDIIGNDYKTEEFYLRGKEKNDVSLVFKDDVTKTGAYLTGPLILDNKPIGVLVIKTNNNMLLSMVQNHTGLGETGEVTLTKRTNEGDALAFMPFRFNQDAAYNLVMPKDRNTPENKAVSRIEGSFESLLDYRKKEVLAATRFLDDVEWGLVVKIDANEAYRPLQELRNKILIQLFITISVVISIAFYFSKAITKPLINLKDMAKRLSEGDLSAQAEVRSDDEIGQLTKTFNQMANAMEMTFSMLNKDSHSHNNKTVRSDTYGTTVGDKAPSLDISAKR